MAMDSLVSCSDVVKIWDTGGWKLGQSTTMTMQNAVTNSCCWVSNGEVLETGRVCRYIDPPAAPDWMSSPIHVY